MVGRVRADDDHLTLDSRRPDILRVFEELDLVYGPAVGIRNDDGLVLGKVGRRVGPPLGIRGNVGYGHVSQGILASDFEQGID